MSTNNKRLVRRAPGFFPAKTMTRQEFLTPFDRIFDDMIGNMFPTIANDFGDDFCDDFGDDFGQDFGDDFADDFRDDFGNDFGMHCISWIFMLGRCLPSILFALNRKRLQKLKLQDLITVQFLIIVQMYYITLQCGTEYSLH